MAAEQINDYRCFSPAGLLAPLSLSLLFQAVWTTPIHVHLDVIHLTSCPTVIKLRTSLHRIMVLATAFVVVYNPLAAHFSCRLSSMKDVSEILLLRVWRNKN